MRCHSLSKGAALITAIMITAVVATLSTAMMVSQSLLIQQAQMIKASDNLYHLVLEAETLTKQQLLSDWIKQKGQLYNESFHINTITSGGVKLEGDVVDGSRYFNVNSLRNANAITVFTRLIEQAAGLDKKAAMTIANDTYTWVNKGDSFGDYADQNPPYQPAHMPMGNATEMRLITGVDSQIMNQLYPDLIALPEGAKAKININTALKPVLLSLLPAKQATDAVIERITSCRKQSVIKNSKDLDKCLAKSSTDSIKLNSTFLGYTSDYFVLLGTSVMNGHRHSIFVLFKIVPDKTQQQRSKALYYPKVEVLWQRW